VLGGECDSREERAQVSLALWGERREHIMKQPLAFLILLQESDRGTVRAQIGGGDDVSGWAYGEAERPRPGGKLPAHRLHHSPARQYGGSLCASHSGTISGGGSKVRAQSAAAQENNRNSHLKRAYQTLLESTGGDRECEFYSRKSIVPLLVQAATGFIKGCSNVNITLLAGSWRGMFWHQSCSRGDGQNVVPRRLTIQGLEKP
jgi:hypothetical protein